MYIPWNSLPVWLGISRSPQSPLVEYGGDPVTQKVVPALDISTTSPYPPLQIRNATLADADAITTIFLQSFELDPQYVWQYPYRHEYPEIQQLCTRQKMVALLNGTLPHSNYGVEQTWVEIVQTASNEDLTQIVPVAVSIWFKFGAATGWVASAGDMLQSTLSAPNVCNDPAHRPDMNFARNTAFSAALRESANRTTIPEFVDRHLHLAILGTLPDYQRRGAGSALVRNGLDVADREGWGVSLFGSPMGRPVYERQGFELVEEVWVSVVGDEGEGAEGVVEANMKYTKGFYGGVLEL